MSRLTLLSSPFAISFDLDSCEFIFAITVSLSQLYSILLEGGSSTNIIIRSRCALSTVNHGCSKFLHRSFLLKMSLSYLGMLEVIFHGFAALITKLELWKLAG